MAEGGRDQLRRRPAAPPEQEPAAPARRAESAPFLLRLQRSAGNAAVVDWLASEPPAKATVAPASTAPHLPGLLRRQLAPAAETEVIRRGGGARGRRARAAKKKAAAGGAGGGSGLPASTATATTTATTTDERETGETESTETAETERVESGETEELEVEEAEVDEAAALQAVIGEKPMANMVKQFGDSETVVAYADECGHERLKWLIEKQFMTAAALQHYGATFLKTFVGAGETAWDHVSTAKLNSRGIVSGGHDSAVFYAFLRDVGYTVDRTAGDASVWKVWYADADGYVLGTKTVIKGMNGAKAKWMENFNYAIWGALRAKRFGTGQVYGKDKDGWDYGFYYSSGDEVDTVYPM